MRDSSHNVCRRGFRSGSAFGSGVGPLIPGSAMWVCFLNGAFVASFPSIYGALDLLKTGEPFSLGIFVGMLVSWIVCFMILGSLIFFFSHMFCSMSAALGYKKGAYWVSGIIFLITVAVFFSLFGEMIWALF